MYLPNRRDLNFFFELTTTKLLFLSAGRYSTNSTKFVADINDSCFGRLHHSISELSNARKSRSWEKKIFALAMVLAKLRGGEGLCCLEIFNELFSQRQVILSTRNVRYCHHRRQGRSMLESCHFFPTSRCSILGTLVDVFKS
jgi:hypothetical protein